MSNLQIEFASCGLKPHSAAGYFSFYCPQCQRGINHGARNAFFYKDSGIAKCSNTVKCAWEYKRPKETKIDDREHPYRHHGWREFLQKRHISEAQASHLKVPNLDTAPWQIKDRLCIPLNNYIGQTLRYNARKLRGDDDYRYVYYPDGSESDFPLCYGVDNVVPGSQIIVVESALDAIFLNGYLKEYVAIARTSASISQDFISLLKALSPSKMILAFDNDKAGQQATNKLIDTLASPFVSSVNWELMPEYKDFGDVAQDNDSTILCSLLERFFSAEIPSYTSLFNRYQSKEFALFDIAKKEILDFDLASEHSGLSQSAIADVKARADKAKRMLNAIKAAKGLVHIDTENLEQSFSAVQSVITSVVEKQDNFSPICVTSLNSVPVTRYPLANLPRLSNMVNFDGLTLIGGPPGTGKTTFALAIALDIAQTCNMNIIFVSLDMPAYRVKQRIPVALHSALDRLFVVERKQFHAVFNRRQMVSSLHKFNDSKSANTMLILDYLQKIPFPADKYENDLARQDRLATELQALAQDIQAPVIVISEMSKSAMQDPSDGLNSFKGSVGNVYNTDHAIGLRKLTDNELYSEVFFNGCGYGQRNKKLPTPYRLKDEQQEEVEDIRHLARAQLSEFVYASVAKSRDGILGRLPLSFAYRDYTFTEGF